MRENECRIVCPSCGTNAVSKVPGKAACSNSSCYYMFQVFSKHDRQKALDFYMTQPSSRMKYLERASDGRWCVSFCEEVKTFVSNTIVDLIEPEVLQSIVTGITNKLERAVSVTFRLNGKVEREYDEMKKKGILQVIEKDGEKFGRIDPEPLHQYYCKRCEKIRKHPDGERSCILSVVETLRGLEEYEMPEAKWMVCWAGFIDYAVPIVINNVVFGVFSTGQIRWMDSEGEQKLQSGSSKAARISSLSRNYLLHLADDSRQNKATRTEMDEYLSICLDAVRPIFQTANNRYWAGRRAREAEFLGEVAASFAAATDEELMWKVFQGVLKRINEFAHFRFSFFGLETTPLSCSFKAKASSGLCHDEPNRLLQLCEEEVNLLFKKSAPLMIRQSKRINNRELYRKVVDTLTLEDPNCVLAFPCKVSTELKGVLILAERRSEIPLRKNVGIVTEERRRFLETVVHEMVVEIRNHITFTKQERALREKDDFIASSGHALVGPLDTLFGMLERLKTLVAQGEPGAIKQNAAEIGDLCNRSVEGIIRSMRRIRSFLFFTTLDSESDEYRFDRFLSVEKLVKECADEFRYFASRRGITIAITVKSEIPRAGFDREKLVIALNNVLDNAVKYSHAKRSVNVALDFDEKSHIYTISISDFGLAVYEHERKLIFDKYYRSDRRDPRRFIAGSGVGLAVAKRIIEKHGGIIQVTSKQGPGVSDKSSEVEGFNTTFWIEIHQNRKVLHESE